MKLQQKLHNEISVYYRQHTFIQPYQDSLWIRISFYQNVLPRYLPIPSNNIYLIYYPNSHVLLTTAMKKEHENYILYALSIALGCKVSIPKKMALLEGKNPDALAELALHSASQGPYSSYRLQHKDLNPLVRKIAQNTDPKSTMTYSVEEDQELTNKRKGEATHAFGDLELPALDRVEFKFSTGLHGKAVDMEYEEVYKCKARFEGMNILEGLKELMQLGIASCPLPPYLEQLHSMEKTKFILNADGTLTEDKEDEKSVQNEKEDD